MLNIKKKGDKNMKIFQRVKASFLMVSVLCIVLGVCLIIWPQISALTICYLAGALILAGGVAQIIAYFRCDVFGIPLSSTFALGLLNAVVGLLLILHPGGALTLLPVVMGIFIVIDGVFKLQTALDAKRALLSKWWLLFLMAVVDCLLGILLVCNPFEGAAALMIWLGITLVTDGVLNIWSAFYISRFVKNTMPRQTIFIESDSKKL